MIPTTGTIIETCLYVADVDRATEWYRQIFGFPIIFQQEDQLRALQVAQDQVLLLFKEKASLKKTTMPGGVLPPHDGSASVHIAFAQQRRARCTSSCTVLPLKAAATGERTTRISTSAMRRSCPRVDQRRPLAKGRQQLRVALAGHPRLETAP